MDEPDDDGVPAGRPLPAALAPAWAMAALGASLALFSLTAALRPAKGGDIVNLQLCFSAGLAVVTWGVARFHLPSRPAADALGLRAVPWWVIALSGLIGCAMLLPAAWIDDRIEQLFPRSAEEAAARAEALSLATLPRKIAFAVAAMGLGPVSEDLFFRGAMFRATRRTEAAAMTVASSALAFAIFHVDARMFPIALLGGLVLGVLRLRTGSVLASTTAHVAYNGVITLGLLGGRLRIDSAGPPHALAAAGLAATLALTWAVSAWAQRSAALTLARTRDAE
ncbi:MAG: CPBP family intramembrane metalloprotease [Polyangiaceae bacterium]|nr:CPBP family intramembrane metalloprotease [Polyangiaceae bacterium]